MVLWCTAPLNYEQHILWKLKHWQLIPEVLGSTSTECSVIVVPV